MIVPATTSEQRLSLVAYMASKMGISPETLVGQTPFEALSVTRQRKPVGAVLYNNFRTHSIEMACAGEPGWLTGHDLRAIFSYPFTQLGCWTVLTAVPRRNATARAFNRKLGFRELCVLPVSDEKQADTILYAMTRPECRWIKTAKSERRSCPINGAAHVDLR